MEIVFSDSLAASMKMAQNYDAKAQRDSMIGYIGDQEPTEAELGDHFAGQALEGAPSDVLTIGFQLDIGNIERAVDGLARRELYQSVEKEHVNEIFQQLRRNEEILLESAQQGKLIRVWHSNAPFSACGFAYVCNLLKDIDCSLSVVDMPEFITTDTGTLIHTQHWEDLPAGQLYRFVELAREVTSLEKTVHSQTWQTLQEENAPLRAVVNGKLISVPENFYDHLIEKEIPAEPIMLGNLVGNLFRYELGIGDTWFVSRIEKMIAAGELQVRDNQKAAHPYEKKLSH